MKNTDHIAVGVPSPLIGPNLDELGPRFPDMSEVYSTRIRTVIKEAASACQMNLKEGVYVQLTGPNYETPAEIRMCRSWGGDAVGMSLRGHGSPSYGHGNRWDFLYYESGSRYEQTKIGSYGSAGECRPGFQGL